ncbi:MAG: hypothetical protein M3Y30_02800 [Gemmatimonadota bacterium]|nr:hypothetical protein [Gemmatimonadota bacterium]
MYTIPALPTMPSAMAALASDSHGALSMAPINNTAQKCTMVGVANASS